jgi:heme oxygenase
MLVRLGLETSHHHGPADDDRLAALSITSLADYRAFLVRVFGFEAPIEEAVSRVCQLDMRFIRDRARMPLLRRDLMELGYSEQQFSHFARAPGIVIRSGTEALGWMFVLERQTLLAGLVQRQIKQALGTDTPLGYLGASGDKPGARFREFGTRLGELARTHSPTTIVEAANAAFRIQRQWYAQKDSDDQVLPTGVGQWSASA